VILADANQRLDGRSLHEARMLAFTAFANVTGLPAISLPMGTDDDGLPVGVQLVGGPFQEARLIRLGSLLEKHAGWASRVPDGYR
jgi:amidase